MVIRSFFVGLVVLLWASAASANGLDATLRCGPANQPADIMECLGTAPVVLSREGVKTVVSGPAVLKEGTLDGKALLIHGPKNFSVQARNMSPDHVLALEIRRSNGKVVFEQTAKRFATVAFYRCGPNVEFQCRDYNNENDPAHPKPYRDPNAIR